MDRFDWIELEYVPRPPSEPAERVAPHDAPSFYRAAEDMYRSGHFRAAITYYRHAIGRDHRHYDAWTHLIDTLIRAGQLSEADTTSAQAIDEFGRMRPLYAARALALGHLRKWKDAWEFSSISLDTRTASWYAHVVRGELLLLENRATPYEALGAFEAALSASDHAWRAALLSGWALLDADLPHMAAAMFAEAARYEPTTPLIWICMGDCFHRLRLYEHAMFYYECAAKLDPKNDLVLRRRKWTSRFVYGLMRVFRRENVRKRWEREYQFLVNRWLPREEGFE